GLGEAVDRRAPVLVEQQKDGRDQRSGVTDTDPPDEVDDRECPADRVVDAPDAGAVHEQPRHGHHENVQQQESDAETDPPAVGMPLLEDDVADAGVDALEVVAGSDDRRRPGDLIGLHLVLHGGHQAWLRTSSSTAGKSAVISGFGLKTSARYDVRGLVPSSASSV